MSVKRYIFTLFALFFSFAALAQEDNHLFEQAQEAYELGLFQKADSLLAPAAGTFGGETRIGVYRLLALCNLNMDKPQVAETWVTRLLAVDPYYRVYNDVPRFTEMVNRIRAGKAATITTASQQAESVEEAPVPVSLITEDMIQRIGARTLKDALVAYVPGMTDIACNEEMNVAMRGIYSSGQEKILVMLDGHRLNSYSTNTASPDFSISLEKVKQIEVLRGPASSLYGGVALTGVVNIITKDGSDVDGLLVKAGGGSHGQVRGDLLFGKHFLSLDILAWASIYRADGQYVHYTADAEAQPYAVMPMEGDMIIGGYNKAPSYDLGLSLKWEKMHLLYNRRFSKTVAPLSLSYFFTPYEYYNYRLLNNYAPGYAISSQHAELGYSDSKNHFSWQVAATFDSQNQQRYQIDGNIPEVGSNDVIPNGMEDVVLKLYDYVFQSVSWREYTLGLSVQGSYNYAFGKSQSGVVMLGGQSNRFVLSDASYLEGINYDLILKTYNDTKVLNPGKETSADAYLQVKHNFGHGVVLNAGMRYDFKQRSTGKKLHVLSPRIALIYSRPRWSAKLSYSKAFVDAPYFYRNNTLDINYGNDDLSPEYLNSWQLSFYSDGKLVPGLKVEVNGFVNKADQFIIQSETGNANAGSLTNAGVEMAAGYTISRFKIDGNFTWQRVLSSENFAIFGRSVYNIPDFQANLAASYAFRFGLKLNAHALYVSKQKSQYALPGMDPLDIDIPSRIVFDAGISYSIRKFEVGLNVYNLGNTVYLQGGSSVAPMRQAGRWLLGHISYKF